MSHDASIAKKNQVSEHCNDAYLALLFRNERNKGNRKRYGHLCSRSLDECDEGTKFLSLLSLSVLQAKLKKKTQQRVR